MSAFNQIKEEFFKTFQKTTSQGPFADLMAGKIGEKHYAAIMKEVYFHARENPQLQAMATAYFRGKQRNSIKDFYRHAISEIGHDQMALEDAIGSGAEGITETSNPLPSTIALVSYGFYQIQYRNPLGYIGYLFFLEFSATSGGHGMADALLKAGVKEENLTFLREHAIVDVGHNRMIEKYIEEMVKTDEDIREVIFAIRVTADLYSKMLEGAVKAANESDHERYTPIKTSYSEFAESRSSVLK